MKSVELIAKLTGRTYIEVKPKILTSAILKERIQKHIVNNNIPLLEDMTSGIKVEGASLKTERRKLEIK